MLDELLGSGSEFDRTSAVLGLALRRQRTGCRSLNHDDLETFRPRQFVVGWVYTRNIAGVDYQFRVLLDEEFPRSRIRIAIAEEYYLRWPHVEEQGVLCLPPLVAPLAAVEAVLLRTLDDAETLVDRCATDPAFVESELSREFLSYWQRSVKDDSVPVRSLLEMRDRKTRRIALWRGQSWYLVAESKTALELWSKNRGQEVKATEGAYFSFLNRPLIPPFPETAIAFLALLEEGCPEIIELFKNSRTSLDQTIVFVLAADAPSGVGLIAASLKLGKMNGFRKDANLSPDLKLKIWQRVGHIEARKVERVDTSWIHGRGMNTDLDKLVGAKVAVLGCGSIGSQVAMRLAQLGVGTLALVDGELLDAANVGRHALGVSWIGMKKVNALASEIRRRFPHIKEVVNVPKPWQMLTTGEMEKLAGVDLIVSCIGDWAAEGLLNDWQRRQQCKPPILYGWLDEQGTAAHALCLREGPCLACILDGDGQLRVPETDWKDGGGLQSEPACGAIFQPYGPTDVLTAEALICNLAIDVLTGKSTEPEHRIHATSTVRVKEVGGAWSEAHLKVRPRCVDGPYEFSRAVELRVGCRVCGGGA